MTDMPQTVRIFRHKKWFPGVFLAMTAVFLMISILLYRSKSEWWLTLFMGTLSLGCLAACVEGLRTSVSLTKDSLVLRQWPRQCAVSRRDIEKVTWEKGCGVAVLTKAKKWVKIPEIIGYNSQAMTNSIRAWVKKGHSA